MIQYNDALKKIENEFKKLKFKTENIVLLDSVNRIIAENIYSDTDQPPFTNSSMDGFAVKYAKDKYKWKIAGEISAGQDKNIKVRSDEAVSIMTGSPIPSKTDTIIPIEDVITTNGTISHFKNRPLKKGMNVRYQGEDLKKGELVIKKNTLLMSNNISIAASCGKNIVKVYKKLKIGVIVTGNELVNINTKPLKSKIRASNLYSIYSAILEMNMTPVSFGIVKDKKEEVKKSIYKALNSGIDILITTGGVSAGKYDFLTDVFKCLGIKVIVWKANIKPGKPVVFGKYEKNNKTVLVYGLPGNPVSCYLNFILFIRNVIANRLVLNNNYNTTAVLNVRLKKSDYRRYFLRGKISNEGGTNFVSPVGGQSSADINGLNSANCIIVFEEELKSLEKGRKVQCIMI